MDVRDATHEDLSAIVALYADDPFGAHREGPSEPLDQAYTEAFAAIEGDAHTRLVVLVDEGRVIGTLQMHLLQHLAFRGGRRAQIEAVRISSDRRGEGLGEQLMRWAIAEAQRHGCHLLQLTTNAERTDAHRFYERLGLTPSHIGMKRDLSGPIVGR